MDTSAPTAMSVQKAAVQSGKRTLHDNVTDRNPGGGIQSGRMDRYLYPYYKRHVLEAMPLMDR